MQSIRKEILLFAPLNIRKKNDKINYNNDNNVNNNNKENDKYYNIINKINFKNVPQKIMKLEKYFECKNESKNIFLICFPENRK